VLGIDGSKEMIAQATAHHPGLSFAVGDAHDFTTSESFDAVASNAALHWMTRDPAAVIGQVHAALRPAAASSANWRRRQLRRTDRRDADRLAGLRHG